MSSLKEITLTNGGLFLLKKNQMLKLFCILILFCHWNKFSLFKFIKFPCCWSFYGAVMHPAGRALSSDWSITSFIMIAFEKMILVVVWRENSEWIWKKKFWQTSIIKLFTDQSELSALPTGSNDWNRDTGTRCPIVAKRKCFRWTLLIWGKNFGKIWNNMLPMVNQSSTSGLLFYRRF